MVTYALTHSTSFAMGIGGGNVTDWSLYDSIYTERFMLMPQNNPDGYARNSSLSAARNLHGQILLDPRRHRRERPCAKHVEVQPMRCRRPASPSA